VDLLLKQLTAEEIDRRLRASAIALGADVIIRNHPRVKPVLAKAAPQYFEPELPEVEALSSEWRRNFEYFRNWVAPELMRPNREDELACLGCHAVPGRVPSMELAPAKAGYMDAQAVYHNYRTLAERVNENNVEESKLLRKPLNVQSGKEDGHQGGRRYNPNDRGYEILRRWAIDVARLKRAPGSAATR
jgi:hypothetical protein